ncbi:MAG: pilus assembly protein PilM [Planctomycetes bacterium]|nr:pilus assembly protein PilM [Planctomycetota bacterium]
MKLITRTSPIAVHFGALETRILQLNGGPKGWAVRCAEEVDAAGGGRHMAVVENLQPRIKELKTLGKDCLVSLSGDDVAVSLVPVDEHNRSKMQQTLKDTALRSINDPEGVMYRYIPLNGSEHEENMQAREELLLLSVGQSEKRRCEDALDNLRLRTCGLEVSAFPLARSLQAMHGDLDSPWGFLHLGFGHSFFGIMQGGELRFLKPMQLNGERLVSTLDKVLNAKEIDLTDISFGDVDEEDSANAEGTQATSISKLAEQAIGRGAELLHALRLESESVAQEVRACLRHYANRHRGAKLNQVFLTGFGANLPEVEGSLATALKMPTEIAQPFTKLGIDAPQHVLDNQHLWAIPLGLAMRGYK